MNNSVLRNTFIPLLFIVVSVFIYANALNTPFIFDDIHQIENNPDIRIDGITVDNLVRAGFGGKWSINRPIPRITFALNYYFHQYHLEGYHLVNIIIHIVTGILLYFFIKTTLERSPSRRGLKNSDLMALSAALLWFVHPLHTQSVTYVVQRMNSLCAMFYLLAMLLYIHGRIRQKEKMPKGGKPSGRFHRGAGLYFAGSLLAWLMALGSKQNAAVWPFIVFLYEWYFFQNLDRDWLKRNLTIFFLAVLLFGTTILIFLGTRPLETLTSIQDFANHEFTFLERVRTQPGVVIYYLSLVFYPHPSRLQLDYDFPLSGSLIDPASTLPAFSAIIALLWLAYHLARRERVLSFCLLWFLGNLAIESSVVPLAVIYEHRTYLPSMLIGLFLILAGRRFINPKAGAVILATIIVLFAFWTCQRNIVWGDPVEFWRFSVRQAPNKARPYYNLGLELNKNGAIDNAIEQYEKAIHIRPGYHLAQTNLGNALLKKGRVDDAIKHYQAAIQIQPDDHLAHYNLGNALYKKGLVDDAITHFRAAVRINPTAEAHTNLGAVLLGQGRLDEAIDHFKAAIGLNPGLKIAYSNLGNALLRKGDTGEAIMCFRKALQIDPGYGRAKYGLKQALKMQNKNN